jgi:hypothetical protein
MRDDVSVRDATADDLPATASIIASDAGGTVDEWHTRFAAGPGAPLARTG